MIKLRLAVAFLLMAASVRHGFAQEPPAAAAAPAPASATGELTGSVLHSATEAPIAGARLQIESAAEPGNAKLIPVDPSGGFSVSLLPGDYKLRISAEGFVTGLYNVSVKEKRRAKLTLKLNPLPPPAAAGAATATPAPVAAPEAASPAGSAAVPAEATGTPAVQAAALAYETLAAESGYNPAQLKIQPLKEIVPFGEGQTTLAPSAMATLDKLAALIAKRQRVLKVVLKANSDEANDADLKARNANRRAVSVKNYLITKGVDPAKVMVDDKPLESKESSRAVGFELVFVP